MIRVLLPALAILAGFVLWRSYRDASPDQRKLQLKTVMQTLVVTLVVVLALRSGLIWLAVAVASVWGVTRVLSAGAANKRAGSEPAPRQGQRRSLMSRADALAILGLGPQATEAQVQERYKQLMRDAHPDHGGDPDLAVKLNQAKEVLTKHRP